jgi:dihydrofolate synthase / folylpolyglutamate synthase
MTYEQTQNYLYQKLPAFHRIGAAALKPGLQNIEALCEALGNPHRKFKSIHIAGTNGKGSTSHYLSAILQTANYKVGLHTSPHLKSFTERFKINGQAMAESYVVDFVAKHQMLIEKVSPSFFEISVAMAFDYFANQQVDVAIIEVGLGGRLDSTNIITPILSVITNISFDHTNFLGNTLAKIATEKAGIIKPSVPVVITETHNETQEVFITKSRESISKIYFSDNKYSLINSKIISGRREATFAKSKKQFVSLSLDLLGEYQLKNLLGVFQSVEVLKKIGFTVSKFQIKKGIENTVQLTNFKGRWQVLAHQPYTVADVAHNVAGLTEVVCQISSVAHRQLHLVLGFVKDKDVKTIIELFPQNAIYYFCQPDNPRAFDRFELQVLAKQLGRVGEEYASVVDALVAAQQSAQKEDFIYIGGSTFVVSEVPEI